MRPLPSLCALLCLLGATLAAERPNILLILADDQGYGWSIAKALRKAGARVIITTWPPALNILRMSLERGKLDTDMGDGTQLTFEKVYPLDAMFDQMTDVPEDVRNNKRYQDLGDFTIRGLRDSIERDFGAEKLDIVVHSLANGPEVQKPLIETSPLAPRTTWLPLTTMTGFEPIATTLPWPGGMSSVVPASKRPPVPVPWVLGGTRKPSATALSNS